MFARLIFETIARFVVVVAASVSALKCQSCTYVVAHALTRVMHGHHVIVEDRTAANFHLL